MVAAKLTSKGQLTVPKAMRDRLGLRPGDHVEFDEIDGGFRVRKVVPESPFDEFRGFLVELAGRDPDALVDEIRGGG